MALAAIVTINSLTTRGYLDSFPLLVVEESRMRVAGSNVGGYLKAWTSSFRKASAKKI